MNNIGQTLLVLAWLLSLIGTITGAIALYKRSADSLAKVTNYLLMAVSTATVGSLVVLAYLFLISDFSNQYVWQFSNRAMATVYKVTAIWGGMDGSMLLWAGLLSVSAAIFALTTRQHSERLYLGSWMTLHSSVLFFLTVVTWCTNPFRWLNSHVVPADGNGLNPLLQNPYMAIHPPMLYLGFTTFAVPAAVAFGALFSGELSSAWLSVIRRWTLIAWGFLTCGIVLGGYWAYIELGWGGFWAWDPVENASFLPWLTGTAFLHSCIIQQRRDMLKSWNLLLVILTYALTVFGTFLTRSGVVQSVHAFASTDVGWVFLLYLGIIAASCVALLYLRATSLRGAGHIESLLSREAFFIFNNIVFLGICFATAWGVLFPVFSEAISGEKLTVGIPFFNAINVPLFLIMLALMAVGQLIAYRRSTLRDLRRQFFVPLTLSLIVVAALMGGGITKFYPLLSYGLCTLVIFSLGMQLRADLRRTSLEAVATKHATRYGAYLAHVGVAIMSIAITASMAHKTEKEFSLAPGEEFKIGRYTLTLQAISDGETHNYDFVRTPVAVTLQSSGAAYTELLPELRIYRRNGETTSEVALVSSWREDLYLVLAGLDDSGTRAALKVFINPLQVWLWIGTAIVLLGTAVTLLPRREN